LQVLELQTLRLDLKCV